MQGTAPPGLAVGHDRPAGGPDHTRYAGSSPMSDTSKIAKNLQAFQMAINAHDRENPTHNAYGIGLSAFDMDRLGLDEGERILPGITIHCDAGVSGNFRVLCDGDHDEDLEEAEESEVVEAVSVRSGGRDQDDGLDTIPPPSEW